MVENIHKPINKLVSVQQVEIVPRSRYSLCDFELLHLFIWCFVICFVFLLDTERLRYLKKKRKRFGQNAKLLFETYCHSISWLKNFAYFVPQDFQLVDLFGQPPCPTPSFSFLGQDAGEVALLKRNEISHIRLGRWIDRQASLIFVETLTV